MVFFQGKKRPELRGAELQPIVRYLKKVCAQKFQESVSGVQTTRSHFMTPTVQKRTCLNIQQPSVAILHIFLPLWNKFNLCNVALRGYGYLPEDMTFTTKSQ